MMISADEEMLRAVANSSTTPTGGAVPPHITIEERSSTPDAFFPGGHVIDLSPDTAAYAFAMHNYPLAAPVALSEVIPTPTHSSAAVTPSAILSRVRLPDPDPPKLAANAVIDPRCGIPLVPVSSQSDMTVDDMLAAQVDAGVVEMAPYTEILSWYTAAPRTALADGEQMFLGQLPLFMTSDCIAMCLDYILNIPGAIRGVTIRSDHSHSHAPYALVNVSMDAIDQFRALDRRVYFGRKNVFTTRSVEKGPTFQRVVARILGIDAERPSSKRDYQYARSCLVTSSAKPAARSNPRQSPPYAASLPPPYQPPPAALPPYHQPPPAALPSYHQPPPTLTPLHGGLHPQPHDAPSFMALYPQPLDGCAQPAAPAYFVVPETHNMQQFVVPETHNIQQMSFAAPTVPFRIIQVAPPQQLDGQVALPGFAPLESRWQQYGGRPALT